MVDLLGGSINLPCPKTLPTNKGSKATTTSTPILMLQLWNHLVIQCLSSFLLVWPILALVSLDVHLGKSPALTSNYGQHLKQTNVE